jgi:DNA ligase-1
MLAGKVEDINDLVYPLFASPKLDGVRAMIIDGVVMSRSMKPIPNQWLQRCLGLQGLNGLDGELCMGKANSPTVFRDTTSAVMSIMGEPLELWYHVFDTIDPVLPFHRRLDKARSLASCHHMISWLEHVPVHSPTELAALEQQYLALGYEGIMLRSPNGPYKQGRSTTNEGSLLKLKRFSDSEATVTAAIELMHNDNEAKPDERGFMKRSSHQENKRPAGKLGALSVKDLVSGVEFEVGTGFTDGDRHALWSQRDTLPGRIVKYRYFPTGSKDKPRFPTFLGFRAPEDL